jgi:anaerobic magnesium-protoporphyrin IX monomethyl ester cyclase
MVKQGGPEAPVPAESDNASPLWYTGPHKAKIHRLCTPSQVCEQDLPCRLVQIDGVGKAIVRILLVNPKSRLPIDTRTSPSLGLAYLAAVTEQRGDEVQIHDGDVEDQLLASVLREFEPQVVGITANTTQITAAWRDAELVKSLSNALVVLGGPHPTSLPEESAARPSVDVVVHSEGEATWLELLDTWETGCLKQDDSPFSDLSILRSVAGITFQNNGREIVNTPNRSPIPVEELNQMPFPAWHHFKLDRYTNLQPTVDRVDGLSLPILTSRGCPYRCSYCSQIGPRLWRARSADSVLAEWRWLVEEKGAAEIGVLDDSFNIDRQRVLEICRRLVDEKLNHVPWIMINGIRANLADEQVLGAMKRAGCRRTAFGVESGNQGILDSVVDKHLTLDQVRSAFRAAQAVGLETIGFFIIGMPGETEATMDDTIRFACELNPMVANFSIATPFPGTDMYHTVQAGGRILAETWDDFVFFEGKARFEMPGLPADLVERKWKEAYRRFYLRPRRIVRTMVRKETWLRLPRTTRMAWRTVVGS